MPVLGEVIRKKIGLRRDNPEQQILASRNYEATVITPHDFMDDMRRLLPAAKEVDFLFMYAQPGQEQPLPQLTELLKGVVERNGKGSVRISVSKNHIGKSEDKNEDADTEELYTDFEESNIDMYFTQSQGKLGKLPLPCVASKGWIGNVHSKLVQIRTEDKVYTYLPEFNLTKRNIDQVNHAIRFVESVQDAEQEGSISQRAAEYMRKVRAGEKFSDYSQDIDENLRFVADAGKFDKSIIRTTAWQEVMGPSEHDIALKNQYPPLGSLLKGLKRKAHQGEHSYVLLSADCRKGKYEKENRVFQRRIRKLRDKIHVRYARETEDNPNGVVHSKNLISDVGMEMGADGNVFINQEAKKGKAIGLATSNNMTPAGYLFSTGEAGILTLDQELLDRMAKLFVEEFNNASDAPEFAPVQ